MVVMLQKIMEVELPAVQELILFQTAHLSSTHAKVAVLMGVEVPFSWQMVLNP